MRMFRRVLALIAVCGACSNVEFAGPPGSAEPNLVALADGGAVLTWFEPTADGADALRVAMRTGGTWSEPRTIVQGREFFVNWADFPALAVLEDGTWVVHWLEKVAASPYAYHVKLARSGDRGATWSAPITPHRDLSPTEHGFVSMVPWNDGAALVWLDGRAMSGDGPADGGHALPTGAMTLRFTTLAADGTLGPDVLLDERTCECCQTALARTARGLVAAYRDRSPTEIRDIAVVRFVDGRWTEPALVASDNWHYPGCPVNGPQLAATGDTVVVAWFTAPEQVPRVHVAFSTDGGASFGAPIRVDDGRPSGRVDVELLSDGSAVATWLEIRGEVAEILARSVRRDGTMGAPWRVGTTSPARSSGFPRMVRLPGDELLVAWTLDEASGGIRVAVGRPAG